MKLKTKYLDFLFNNFKAFFQNLVYLASTGRAPSKLESSISFHLLPLKHLIGVYPTITLRMPTNNESVQE